MTLTSRFWNLSCWKFSSYEEKRGNSWSATLEMAQTSFVLPRSSAESLKVRFCNMVVRKTKMLFFDGQDEKNCWQFISTYVGLKFVKQTCPNFHSNVAKSKVCNQVLTSWCRKTALRATLWVDTPTRKFFFKFSSLNFGNYFITYSKSVKNKPLSKSVALGAFRRLFDCIDTFSIPFVDQVIR